MSSVLVGAASNPARLAAARTALAAAHRATAVSAPVAPYALAHETAPHGVSQTPAADPAAARTVARCIPTGWASIDRALGGGLARGTVVELTGAPSSGRLSAAITVLRRALERSRDPVAFIDGADALDPRGLDATARARVLWVRAPDGLVALRALDLLLEGGGFSLAVLYLVGATPAPRARASARDDEAHRRARDHARERAAALADAITDATARDAEAQARTRPSLSLSPSPPSEGPRFVRDGDEDPAAPALARAAARPATPAALWTRIVQRAARAGTVVLAVTDLREANPWSIEGPGPLAHTRLASDPSAAQWRDESHPDGSFLDGRGLALTLERTRAHRRALEPPARPSSGPVSTNPPRDELWLCAG